MFITLVGGLGSIILGAVILGTALANAYSTSPAVVQIRDAISVDPFSRSVIESAATGFPGARYRAAKITKLAASRLASNMTSRRAKTASALLSGFRPGGLPRARTGRRTRRPHR
jgi:hypothetical protein